MAKQRIYISGKITGLSDEVAERLFSEAEFFLTEQGWEVVNPLKLNHDHDKSWKSAMRVDLAALKTCTHIYALRNWNDSRGARIEVWFGKRYSKKVAFQSNEHLIYHNELVFY